MRKGPVIDSRANKYPRLACLTLDDLPGNSSSRDKFQMYREGIRTQKYLREKLSPPH